jgi:hypothetical protein
MRAVESDPDKVWRVYLMSPDQRRQRSIDDDGEVSNLYQGEAPVFPRDQRGQIYPGNRAIRDNDNVTIQIHIQP